MDFKQIFKGVGLSISAVDHVSPFPAYSTMEVLDPVAHNPLYLSKYLPSERYDYVYSAYALQSLSMPEAALLEWWYAVKPGGHLVLLVRDEDKLKEPFCTESKANGWTFTFWKKKSWNPRSINVAEMFSFLSRAEPIAIERMGDDILAIARKMPQEPLRERVYRHSGARGDIIYGLPTMKALGGGVLSLNVKDSKHFLSAPMSDEEIDGWRELLVGEDYIRDVRICNGEYDVNLDDFRDMDVGNNFLSRCHLVRFAVNFDLTQPWLDSERIGAERVADIVVARSPRYHGPFRWHELKGWEDKCVFVGNKAEYLAFKECTGLGIKTIETSNIRDLARIIAGAKLFIGNQSFPYSLAEAMKVPRVLEVCHYAPNCNPFGDSGYIHLNQNVLRKHVLGERIEENQVVKTHFNFSSMRQVAPARSCVPRKMFPVLGRPLVSFIVPSEEMGNAVVRDWIGFVSNEMVVVGGAANFFEMANAGATACHGDFICCVSDKADTTKASKLMNLFVSESVGLVAESLHLGMFEFVWGDMVWVSRLAYEELGLFSERVSDGAKWIELSTRYCKNKWRKAFEQQKEAPSEVFCLNERDICFLKDAYGYLPKVGATE